MAGDDELAPPVAAPAAAAKRVGPPRPTITLPPRAPMGALFSDGGFGLAGMGFSPGPITLISSLFSPTDECKSFSQLLAGAMASPAAHRVDDGQSGFKQNWADGLLSSPAAAMFMVPPGLSPATLLDSPGFFSPRQGPFGMTHQEALAQVTAQAVAQAQSQIQNQTVENTALMTQAAVPQQKSSILDSRVAILEPNVFPKQQEQNSQPMSFAGDNKPANDGYNWRKYGQKNVKGSECPRSYYKCSQPGCPVKKKVEHGFDGHIKEIIYKGQHNHLPPQKNKRAKEAVTAEHSNSVLRKDQEFSEVVPEHSTATTDSEEVDDGATGNGGRDEDEPEPKRRNTEIQVSETASSQQTVTESRIIVQTRSEVDLLDDGYKWRKYGQKVVKGNPYPRSYYKCTTPGCNVRKHVERAAADPKSVVTTYEGKHNHTVPAAKISGHSIVNSSTSLQKPNPTTGGNHQLPKDLKTDMQKTNVQPIGRLRLKDEQIR